MLLSSFISWSKITEWKSTFETQICFSPWVRLFLISLHLQCLIPGCPMCSDCSLGPSPSKNTTMQRTEPYYMAHCRHSTQIELNKIWFVSYWGLWWQQEWRWWQNDVSYNEGIMARFWKTEMYHTRNWINAQGLSCYSHTLVALNWGEYVLNGNIHMGNQVLPLLRAEPITFSDEHW